MSHPAAPSSIGTLVRAAALALGVFSASKDASADGANADRAAQRCISDHFRGQVEQREGNLLEARRSFAACASAGCPGVVRRECASLNAAVAGSIPTVVPVAVDEDGNDLTNVTVRVDDGSEPLSLRGRALPLDPGHHLLTFESPGHERRRLAVVLREGEKQRPIVVRMRRSGQRSTSQSWHPLTYAFGGLGIVAAGSWTYFGIHGLSERGSCRDGAPCAGGVNADLVRADVSLAVSLLSFGAAAYFLFNGQDPPSESREARASRAPALSFDPRIGSHRAEMSLRGSF